MVLEDERWLDLPLDEYRKAGVTYAYAPTPDGKAIQENVLARLIAIIDNILTRGGRVLAHCYGGKGRSGHLAAAYLVYRGLSSEEAMEHVRSRVPGAIETPDQEYALKAWELGLRKGVFRAPYLIAKGEPVAPGLVVGRLGREIAVTRNPRDTRGTGLVLLAKPREKPRAPAMYTPLPPPRSLYGVEAVLIGDTGALTTLRPA